jgi:hypothetical protein
MANPQICTDSTNGRNFPTIAQPVLGKDLRGIFGGIKTLGKKICVIILMH